MLKLDDISVYGADYFLFPNIRRMRVQELQFIRDNQLESFAQLEKMIKETEKVPAYFLKLYELANKYINRYHITDKEPKIYMFNNLKSLNPLDLKITEEETYVKDLILSNIIITSSWRVTFNELQKLNIKKLRFFLEHVTLDGNNSLKLFDKIGSQAIEKVIKSLYFYEEQIKRQNLEEHPTGANIFALNKDKKQAIVEHELEKYIEYFLSFPYDFIWGKRSNAVNKNLIECLINESQSAINNKKNLIKSLTNYMTLEELETDAIENGSLDRFMLTKSL